MYMLQWEAHVLLWICAISLSCEDMPSFIDKSLKILLRCETTLGLDYTGALDRSYYDNSKVVKSHKQLNDRPVSSSQPFVSSITLIISKFLDFKGTLATDGQWC